MRALWTLSQRLLGAIVLACAIVVCASEPATAFDRCGESCQARSRGREHRVSEFSLYTWYWHSYNRHSDTDPFAYHYRQPRYYPSRSRYWVHDYEAQRADFDLPEYHPAWGYERPQRRERRHRRHSED